MAGSQDYARDPRNEDALIWVDGELVSRAEAKVSIFDAGFSMGDGVWEGLRLHRGRLLFLEAHLERLCAGARALRYRPDLEPAALEAALAHTLTANNMTDGVHVRLMVTRGLKTDVNQDPRNALGAPTVVITAEYKALPVRPVGWGLRLFTSSIRCTGADMFDMRLNSHSRLNLIRALLEAIDAGADEALMLDPHGMTPGERQQQRQNAKTAACLVVLLEGRQLLQQRGDLDIVLVRQPAPLEAGGVEASGAGFGFAQAGDALPHEIGRQRVDQLARPGQWQRLVDHVVDVLDV